MVKSLKVDPKYTKYTVEDFAQDNKFINWALNGYEDKEWRDFMTQNPDRSKDILLAKKIVSALRYSKKDLGEGVMYDTYRNIEFFYNLHQKSKQKRRLRKILQYAALFVLVLSIGATIPIIYFSRNQVRFSESPIKLMEVNDAKLITGSGKEIMLKGHKSDLALNTSGSQLKIGQDSIVNLGSEIGQMAELVVPYGKRSIIELSDGTKVWLNAGSKLIFPQKFTGNNRKVFLKGEGYFEVAENKNVPFIVSAGQMNIKVYGTKFNVNNFDSGINVEVVLVEGEVGVKKNHLKGLFSKEIKLSPYQKAIYNKKNRQIAVESDVDVDYYTSWTEGLLEFNRESILNVFERLSRYYNIQFVTEGSVELNKKISGKLDLKESLEVVMKVVSDAAPITFRIEQDKVFVNNRNKSLPIR